MTAPDEERDRKPDLGEPWSDESPDTDLKREDDRWSAGAQARDWLLLILMIVTYLTWVGIIYFLEPGIR
jgi:hypothetical protein